MNVPEPTHFESLYPPDSRLKEVTLALELIKKGVSVQVCGLPGVGRSNFMRMLAYNKDLRLKHLGENYKWFQFVYMDLSEVKNRNASDLIRFILISLAYSFSERKMKEEEEAVNRFLKESQDAQDELVVFQSLKRAIDYLALERELTIILMFDRFDSYFPNLNSQFFTNLKILRNRAKYRFSCMFSLPRAIEDMLDSSIYGDFYEFIIGNTIYLPLKDTPANNFRFEYLARVSGKKLDEKTKESILTLTGGHGKLSRLALELVLGGEKTPDNLSEYLLSKHAIQGALLEIWNALLPAEQRSLLTPVSDKTHSDLYLERCGLIEKGTIQIPLFASSLDTFPAPTGEKITIDDVTNEIKMGNESLSEILSASEFKLLKFLIQNHDRVCEKEEIISAVWTDAKTQEGVTDQALDQIVYRLRKKVEADPNKPVHIQTIKGRGYKFLE